MLFCLHRPHSYLFCFWLLLEAMRRCRPQSQPILWICFTVLISTCTLPDRLPLSITDTLKGPGLGSRTLALYSRSMDTMNLEGLWSHGFVSFRIFWIIFHFTQRIPKPTKLKIKLKGPREDLKIHRGIFAPDYNTPLWDAASETLINAILFLSAFLVNIWNFSTSCITKDSK